MALGELNRRVESAVRETSVGTWEVEIPDRDFTLGKVACSSICDYLGHGGSAAAVDFARVVEVVHPDDRASLEAATRACLSGETPAFEVEARARRADGTYRWLLARGAATRDAGGTQVRFAGTAVDITGRKRPSHELLDARTLLAACGSDAAILSRICQAVRDQLPKDLTALEHAFRNRDAASLSEEAHRLHGMVAAFSSVAGTLASDLEDRAGQGELEDAERLLNQLRMLAPELLREICGVTLDSLRDRSWPR